MGKYYNFNSNKFGARRVYLVGNVPFGDKKSAHTFATQQDGREVVAFDSVHEYDVFKKLIARQRAGEISCLKRQVVYELLPNQYETIYNKRGKIVSKLIERKVNYTADFVYSEGGRLVVVDAKSKATRTRDYIIRRKLMLYIYNIKIVEM